jgi:hypothetical protein
MVVRSPSDGGQISVRWWSDLRLDLDFNNFEEFIARRKDIIKKQLKEILPFATDIVEDI